MQCRECKEGRLKLEVDNSGDRAGGRWLFCWSCYVSSGGWRDSGFPGRNSKYRDAVIKNRRAGRWWHHHASHGGLS